jgi:hypothetical protein
VYLKKLRSNPPEKASLGLEKGNSVEKRIEGKREESAVDRKGVST